MAMRGSLKIVTVMILAVLTVSFLNFGITVNPVRSYSERTPAELAVEFESVRFRTEDGLVLAGWYVPAAVETNRTLIVGHGYPYDKGDVLAPTLFLQAHFNLLYYDHRSFGESEGQVTTVGLRETRDVTAALDYLEERDSNQSIGGLGFSMSAATMLMSEDDRLEAVVAEAPYADLGQMLDDKYGFLVGPLKWVVTVPTAIYSKVFFGAWPSEVSPKDTVNKTQRPTLLIHAVDDDQIPFSHAEDIMETASGSVELWEVETGGHGRIQMNEGNDYQERIIDHFDTHLV